ncbi:MAG: sigma-70 family RNA polymerase sigma factor [Deltaproteobacteria bacterium]|nr:sigma-70 family RNA polymerase sigma factor [Deltaproteobacteria bacterium]
MGDQVDIPAVFLAELPPALREEIERLIAGILDAGRASWPDIDLPAEAFLAFLAERIPQDADVEKTLRELNAADLYLACACVHKDPRALSAFVEAHADLIRASLYRMRLPDDAVDDLCQLIYQKLLVGDEDSPPRIGQYAGRGELRGWLRVTAVRQALDALRRTRTERASDHDALDRLASQEGDRELMYLKSAHRKEFTQAFRQAIESLESRDRNLLRFQVLDGLNLDQIGAIYKVHRSTVSRWMHKIRKDLLKRTHRALAEQLEIDPREAHSIIRQVQSRLDVSIRFFLQGDE